VRGQIVEQGKAKSQFTVHLESEGFQQSRWCPASVENGESVLPFKIVGRTYDLACGKPLYFFLSFLENSRRSPVISLALHPVTKNAPSNPI
jgi:hypothetical protein